MNTEKFSYAMSEIDSKYVDEAISYHAGLKSRIHFRHLPAAVVAAMLAVLLMGTCVVAAVCNDDIQNWFKQQWKGITGHSMGSEQSAVIDQLSQPINVSQTIGNVTVTADSATVGNGSFYLLLRVEGLNLSPNWGYGFDDLEMKLAPAPFEEGNGFGGYGFEYQGLDNNGAALMLIAYNYAGAESDATDTSPLEVSLWLKDFVNNANTTAQETIAAGEWNLKFWIDRTQLPNAIKLPDTKAVVTDLDTLQEVTILFHNIELTSTGMNLQYECDETETFLEQVCVEMKDGTVVDSNGSFGMNLDDGETMEWSFQWKFPIDLNEVEAIKIGSTRIDIPSVE
jgi:hypothetical protein